MQLRQPKGKTFLKKFWKIIHLSIILQRLKIQWIFEISEYLLNSSAYIESFKKSLEYMLNFLDSLDILEFLKTLLDKFLL